jgi:hypothetical protein
VVCGMSGWARSGTNSQKSVSWYHIYTYIYIRIYRVKVICVYISYPSVRNSEKSVSWFHICMCVCVCVCVCACVCVCVCVYIV